MQNIKIKIVTLIRFAMGFIFLWAFIDKTFGLGFATKADKAWINGNSPTFGFLKFATKGPLAEIFQGLAGQGWVDWLFMIGLLLIGLALILGIGLKIAAISGSILMLLMWLSLYSPKNNPLIDDHIIYILVLWLLYLEQAGEYLGIGKWWENLQVVQKHTWLK